MTHRIWFRPAMACLVVAALGVAACTTPTEYDVALGQRVTLALDGAGKDAGQAVDQVAAWLEDRPGVEGVMVQLQECAGQAGATGTLMVWGQSLDGAVLRRDLAAAFPDLDAAAISVEAIEGTVEGSLAEAMGHSVLGLEVSGETADEVRAGILAQLAAQGFAGDAQVEVIDADGQRTVNIELNDVRAEGDAAADEVIIELKKQD